MTSRSAVWATPVELAPWRLRALNALTMRLRVAWPEALDCVVGSPDLDLLPLDLLRHGWRAALDETAPEDLASSLSAPAPALRDALLPRLEADQIPVRGRDLVVASSLHQLLVLMVPVAAAWSHPEELLFAVEEPGYPLALDMLERAGCRLLGVAVDGEGVVPASLVAALAAGACAVLLTPRAHNPTGVSWSVRRLAEVADALAAHPGVLVIEDDYFAGLANPGPGSLLADPRIEERVVYVRSFSAAVAPDLRVAVAAARPRLREHLAHAKGFVDGWTSLLAQRALGHILTDDTFDAALARARQVYAQRRSAIVHAIHSRLAARAGVATGADGLHVWVRLPPMIDAAQVIEHAAAEGVLAAPGELFYIRPGHGHALRLTLARITAEHAAAIGAALATAVQRAEGGDAIPPAV